MAVFNSGYPVGYQNPYQMQQQRAGGIKWTQGMAGVQAQYVAPGMLDLFMDSEQKQFYIKTVDVSGMPMPIRTFRYEEITDAPKQEQGADFVTREEFDKRMVRIEALMQKEAKDE